MAMKEKEERLRKTGQHGAVLRSVTCSAAVNQESVQKFKVDVNIHRSIYCMLVSVIGVEELIAEYVLLELSTACLSYIWL